MPISEQDAHTIKYMSEKKRLQTICDITANLAIMQGVMQSLDRIKPDSLDSGFASEAGLIRHKIEQERYVMNDKLQALLERENLQSNHAAGE